MIAIIYFAIRIISRYVLPILLDKGVKNMQEKMNERHRQQQNSSRPEGEVTIEKKPDGKNDIRDKGEYVDFEEVE